MAARIVFIGDPLAPGHDPAQIELDGVVFQLGVAVDVSDEALAARLARHSHFALEMTPVVVPEAEIVSWEQPEAVAELAPIKRGPGRPRKNP